MNKISTSRQKKETIVKEITDKVGRAKAMVFTNYQGMTHRQMEELKKALHSVDAEMAVTKNTLLKRALDKSQSDEVLNSALQNPTATIFAYSDPITPIKELAKVIKSLKLPTIKFGILEGNVVTEADVTRLATLPSRDALIAQVIGGMKAPLYGLHRTLQWNIQKLALILRAIEQKR